MDLMAKRRVDRWFGWRLLGVVPLAVVASDRAICVDLMCIDWWYQRFTKLSSERAACAVCDPRCTALARAPTAQI